MAYDPNSPAQDHAGLSDVDKIRNNTNALREFEAGSSEPSNPVAGMIWLYTPGTGNWVLRQRNKDNNGWEDLWELTTAGVPKTHFDSDITESNSVHGAQQGHGNGFDADTLDGKHADQVLNSVPGSLYTNNDNEVIACADAEQAHYNTTWTKKKEIKLNTTVDTLKISFELKGSTYGDAYGLIYRNGSPIGTERLNTDTSWVEYTEEISGWSDGDLLQLYIKSGLTPYGMYAQKFRIRGEKNWSIKMD